MIKFNETNYISKHKAIVVVRYEDICQPHGSMDDMIRDDLAEWLERNLTGNCHWATWGPFSLNRELKKDDFHDDHYGLSIVFQLDHEQDAVAMKLAWPFVVFSRPINPIYSD